MPNTPLSLILDTPLNILCFCETWLNASQPTPVLLDDQVDIRCDRMTNENRGGVLICVPSHMSPTNVHRLATSGIEAVSATIQLPNSDNLQRAVVYRSPSVSQATLTTLLTRLLTHIQYPVLYLAILTKISYIANSVIFSLMSSFGFKQIVPYQTTPQATLIDHVYYRNTAGHSISAIV